MILTLDKIEFKTKTVRRYKEGHCIVLKWLVHEENKNINLYTPNCEAHKYVKVY